MGANTSPAPSQILNRKWMSTYEVAERLAGFERGAGRTRTVNPETKRPSYEVHPDVRRWRQRLHEAMQAAEIVYYKDDDKAPNASCTFEWADVERWANRRWPRQRSAR